MNALPLTCGRCYACARSATGLRDRRPEGHDLEPACPRHADPAVRSFAACAYCLGPLRRGSLDVDGMFAHKRCHQEASR